MVKRNSGKWMLGGLLLLLGILIGCSQINNLSHVDYSGNYVMYDGPFTRIQINPDKSVWVSFGGLSTQCTVTTNRILFIQGYDTTELSVTSDGKFINYKHKDLKLPHLAVRVNDSDLWSAYQTYFQGNFSGAIPIFEKYLQSHPENSFSHICLSNCLFQQGQYNKAKTELGKVDSSPELQSNPFLKSAYNIVKYCLIGKEKSAAGLNACDGYDEALKNFKTPSEYNREIYLLEVNPNPISSEDWVIVQKYITGNMSSIQTFLNLPEKPEYYDFRASSHLIGGNYMKNHVLAKSVALYARLFAENGQIQPSVDAYRKIIRMGQQMMLSPYLHQLIGTAIRTFGTNGMGLLYSQQRITNIRDANWVLLVTKELRQLDPVSTPETINKIEIIVNSPRDLVEVLVRMRVAETKLILLETTAAIKAYQIKESKLPNSNKDLVPDYLPEIPMDTFGKNPINYVSGEKFKIYSYGPDTTDDGGKILYDPTNGTISRGDVIFP